MKEYTGKSEAASRTLDSHPKASRQASWDVILQEYAARDKQTEEVTAVGEEKAGQAKSSLEGGSRPVQRQVANAKLEDGSPHRDAVITFFNSFDAQALKAYQYVLSVPSLGALAGLNGYTRLWIRKWMTFLGGGKPELLPAAFGYVIETLVCNSSSGFRPAPPAGYTFIMQLPVGGTRPDVVLMQGTTQIAWLDLTASESADHIFSKEGWDQRIPMYAEVTYPSLTPVDLQLMCKNKDNTGSIDPATFSRMVEREKIVYERNKAYWIQLGSENFTRTSCREQIPHPSSWTEEQFQVFIHTKLKTHFGGADIDMKMVPSILEAMGVSSTAWRYNTGFSQSEGAGEAWLTDHAPAPAGI